MTSTIEMPAGPPTSLPVTRLKRPRPEPPRPSPDGTICASPTIRLPILVPANIRQGECPEGLRAPLQRSPCVAGTVGPSPALGDQLDHCPSGSRHAQCGHREIPGLACPLMPRSWAGPAGRLHDGAGTALSVPRIARMVSGRTWPVSRRALHPAGRPGHGYRYRSRLRTREKAARPRQRW
jgi:hypothetical protein